MKLSELVAQCQGDPEVMIEDDNGIPQPVEGLDLGIIARPGQMSRYVLLHTSGEDDPDDED